MNILLIHNKYGKHSGEEAVVEVQLNLLRSHRNDVETYFRSSEEIRGLGGQVNAFWSGFYNARSVREIRRRTSGRRTADGGQPSIVHIHNLYPLISPAILPVIKSQNKCQLSSPLTAHRSPFTVHHLTTSPPKIVMTVHNYRLICPNGLFFSHGEICEECAGGHEFRCITKNCENNWFKSTGYALRNRWARKQRYYLDHVDAFLCLTEFQKRKLVENGYPAEKCHVLPNFLDAGAEAGIPADRSCVLFAGRVNRQKGFDLLASAAATLPGTSFHISGSIDREFTGQLQIPGNMELTGNLTKEQMENAFQNSRFLAFTSRSYEGFPMVFLEAMKHRLPVIAPNMAGFPEIIEDGINGLLFKLGDAADLAEKIRTLWEDEELCRRLGENGFRKLQTAYSPDEYYKKLINVYSSLVS